MLLSRSMLAGISQGAPSGLRHALTGFTASCTADKGPTCRIAACFAVVFVCWDLKVVFYTIWGPLTFLMGYSDPRKPTNDLLHGAPPAEPE